MKLGLNLGFITSKNRDPVSVALEAENAGYDSVWVAEAWGSDAVSLLSWIGAKTSRIGLGTAILQIPSRTPALIAMTAATLDALSGGRLRLGLGVSGPQVVEGWHGTPYGKPLTRTRECVAIVRQVLKREGPLSFEGEQYQVPIPSGTGLGKPLKLMMEPVRTDIPIYLAAIGPGNVALTAEIADGWLPIFFAPTKAEAFQSQLEAGRQKRDHALGALEVAPSVGIAIGDDLQRCWDRLKPNLALYIGGMGAKNRNFYNDLACRYGYAAEAEQIQTLYLDGKKREATAAVPNELVDDVSLCGPEDRIRDRLQLWEQAGVTSLIATIERPEELRILADLFARM